MTSSRVYLPAVLAVLLGSACFAVGQPATAPAFMWTNTDHLACRHTGQTSRVVYEVLDSDFIGSDMLSGALGKGASEEVQRFIRPDTKPDVTTIFLGSKLQTSDLGRLGGSEELQPLQSALASAKSSLSVPHMSLTAGQSGFLHKVSETVGDAGLHIVGACGPNGTALAPGDVTSAVKHAASGEAQVLVVCAQDSVALSEEMALLHELMSSLEQSEKQNMVMYMSDVVPVERAAPRRLQEVTATKDYTKCDSECMAFVYAIEAGIVLFIVLIAVLTGMACHNMLDAPTKFETPPKGE
mmetsp:Transcript_11743/g.21195  ORF Transcript_11743/g.21195 Transcript_11743/m.21195 type:complete len:297 (-) Transcript_11743:188-1078(-)|eukprot:CAMPEP_0177775292 /NCGR_PEP_ID=MMETSP0491_2-20121128/14011_1 /TAXON_ID=63592 /ORGANISM="Tetraselmis chuii, Strain PLY429" /LENGTH=296 /DNA_ID=CAMNT_0019293825 /DNA_START=124 /DNA_END=1014 /DNA_ORIENTATION=+